MKHKDTETLRKMVSRLEVRNVTKRYSGCVANRGVNLTVQPGEIHALLGENGAGKSTLMKVIYGLVGADAGEVIWEGEKVNIKSPNQGKMLGMGMVFQHFSLFETLTVTENIALSLPRTEKWDLSGVNRKIRILAREYGLGVNPNRPISALSVGERQRVEIIRCLFQARKLLILDEPTAVLTPPEVEGLFVTLRKLAGEGCSILFSSHKLKEIQQICSNCTVLRNGEVVANCNPQGESLASLARMMIGDDVPKSQERQGRFPGAVCLEVRNLSLQPQHPFGVGLQGVNLQVRGGEIVGIAGVAGNGQRELLAALSGEVLCPQADRMMLGEMPIGDCGVVKRRRLGLGYVPEERLGKGAVPDMNLWENALLTAYGQGLLRRGMIRQQKLKAWTQRICDAFDVKHGGLDTPAASLSGGNLQKFILGREIQQNPAVLIAAHPTWGVDVKATATIHQTLMEMRDMGAGVVIVSEDLDELFTLCDRIGVIYKGTLSPLVAITDTNRNQIGRWMGGVNK